MTKLSRALLPLILLALGMLASGQAAQAKRKAPAAAPLGVLHPERVICWVADGEGMQPTADLERFLVDRIGASGKREAIEPDETHAILRILGLQNRTTFSPASANDLAVASGARWVLWTKIVARDVQSKKLLGLPYLFNHRRLDIHVFFDVRVYDAYLQELVGSKRLKLSDRGEGTWQVTEDERMDPAYNNDPVEIHQRNRSLDWEAAALISGYCTELLRSDWLASREAQHRETLAAQKKESAPPSDPSISITEPPE
jgi:hypothetical protein